MIRITIVGIARNINKEEHEIEEEWGLKSSMCMCNCRRVISKEMGLV